MSSMNEGPYQPAATQTVAARRRNIVAEVAAKGLQRDIAEIERVNQLVFSRENKALYEPLLETYPREAFVCIGPGGRFHPGWSTVDKLFEAGTTWAEFRRGGNSPRPDHVWDACDMHPLPFADGSVEAIYCSHVIEHLPVEVAAFLFRDCRRVLGEGGTLRIVAPDLALAARAFDAADWTFFLEHQALYEKRVPGDLFVTSMPGERDRKAYAAWRLLASFSLVTYKENPVSLTYEDCLPFVESNGDARMAVATACDMSDPIVNLSIGGHISWWDAERVTHHLAESGFSDIRRSAYLQSSTPLMRHRFFFDRTDPHQSLHVEAIT